MEELLATLFATSALGALMIAIGIINMTGNISTLHKRHRRKVAIQDRKPMGKIIGLGTLIMGFSLILFGILFFLSQKTQILSLLTIGLIFLIVGFVIGLSLNFYGVIKYNKGLF